MKFGRFITSLFLIYETSINWVVKGQTFNENEEANDCTKLYNFLKKNSKIYSKEYCCIGKEEIECDKEGYIISYSNESKDDQVVFPYEDSIRNHLRDFPYLPKIEKLHLVNYDLKEIPDSILKLTSLKTLNLNENNIKVIPPAIENLTYLKNLSLASNNIKELPNEIFKLKNLKNINLNNNLQLVTEMKNFGYPTLEICKFSKKNNISCYEPRTCKQIEINGKILSNDEAERDFEKCTSAENELNLNQDDNDISIDQKKFWFITIGGIIVGFMVGLIIGSFVAFMLMRKKIKSNNMNNSVSDIQIVVNEKQTEDSKIYSNEKIPSKLEREFLFQNIFD